MEQAKVILSVLKEYEAATGYQVNLSKSSVTFGRGIPQAHKDQIIQELHMREVEHQDKYLGLPMNVGRSKNKAFLATKD